MNSVLRNTSNDLIDLIEKMLTKDPAERIDMIKLLDHPWILKYKLGDEDSDFEPNSEDKSKETPLEPPRFNEDSVDHGQQDGGGSSNHQESFYEAREDNNEDILYSSHNEMMQSVRSSKMQLPPQKQKNRNKLKNNFLLREEPSYYEIFNIAENDNETTNNFARVDMRGGAPQD